MRKIFLAACVLVLLFFVFIFTAKYLSSEDFWNWQNVWLAILSCKWKKADKENAGQEKKGAADNNAQNVTYNINDENVTLVNGKKVGSFGFEDQGKKITEIFQADVYGDVDADGDQDALVILTQTMDGGSVYYYLAAALNDNGVYQGTRAMFIGDRINFSGLEFRDGFAVVGYRQDQSDADNFGFFVYEENRFKGIEYKNNFVELEYPLPATHLTSPVTIRGRAKGLWYFEGSFPIVLTNWDGLIIAEGEARAQGNWISEDFVPFDAKLEFVKPEYKNNGSLILKKDNPSGLPENDEALEIPIFFQ